MDVGLQPRGTSDNVPRMELPHISADQHGVYSRTELDADGWSKGKIDRAVASGKLVALRPGAYIEASDLTLREGAQRHLAELSALILTSRGDWHAARRSAAVLHGLPLLGVAPAEPLLTKDRVSRLERSPSRFQHISQLSPDERTVISGLACTGLARTVYDLARRESFRSGLIVADAALRTGMPRRALETLVQRHAGWPGNRSARRVVDAADGRSESPLESLARAACIDRDLPVFEPQVEVWWDGVLVGRLDGLWRGELVGFEGDGAIKFIAEGVLPPFLARHERLRDAGLEIIRTSWADVHQPADWQARVEDRLRGRAGAQLKPGVRLISTAVRPTPLSPDDTYRWPNRPALVYPTPRRGGRRT